MAGIFKKLHLTNRAERVRCTAVIAAAGSSTRMDGQDKLFMKIGGIPVLALTLKAIDGCGDIDDIIVVTRKNIIADVSTLCGEYSIKKVIKVMEGGDTRLESVFAGVCEVPEKSNLIAVHDGARPFVTPEIISQAVAEASKYHAAVPAISISSTVKYAENGVVVKTPDRSKLFEIQTPQVFAADILKAALDNAIKKNIYITDDSMALEAIGFPVRITQGSRCNIKITTPEDAVFAEAIYKTRGCSN